MKAICWDCTRVFFNLLQWSLINLFLWRKEEIDLKIKSAGSYFAGPLQGSPLKKASTYFPSFSLLCFVFYFLLSKRFNLFSCIFSLLFPSVPFSPLVELTLTSGLRKSGSGGARSCRDSLQMPPMRAPLSPRWLKPIKFNGRYLTRIFGS